MRGPSSEVGHFNLQSTIVEEREAYGSLPALTEAMQADQSIHPVSAHNPEVITIKKPLRD